MHLYFLLIRLAALLGHRKAKKLIAGQRQTVKSLSREQWSLPQGEVIWFHAASVGEFEQARPIIEKLVNNAKTSPKILVTFFSPSGYELRKDYSLADKVMYLPFATRRNAKRFLDIVQPKMAIFVKYEFWPAYLRELHKRNIPTYLISGIFREKQLFFRPWGGWYRRLLHYFTHLFVQDSASADLLHGIGLENVTIAGDTRFDRVKEIADRAKQIPVVEAFIQPSGSNFEPANAAPVIVAGSTWIPDEILLARYLDEHEEVKLVLAPHEIDEGHLHAVFQIFQGRYVRFTEATPLNLQHVRVLVIDTVGLLSSIYRYGQVAYVGGGFGVGIHNTLEPAVFGMPVVFGPNYQHFREAIGLTACGAGLPVKDYESFAAAMDTALTNHTQLGAKAKEYITAELGATATILNNLTI